MKLFNGFKYLISEISNVLVLAILPGTQICLININVSLKEVMKARYDFNGSLFFQALIVQLAPKECIIGAGDTGTDTGKLKQVLDRSNLLVSERKRSKVLRATVTRTALHVLYRQIHGNSDGITCIGKYNCDSIMDKGNSDGITCIGKYKFDSIVDKGNSDSSAVC